MLRKQLIRGRIIAELFPTLVSDFYELTLANELKIPANNQEHLEHYRLFHEKLLAKFEDLASQKAYQCYRQLFK
jgi:hypothetical protein